MPRRVVGDVVAGLSVALVLIPQSLAYAELAGMPPERGLYAAAIPLIVAAPIASSPYLQTGPVAITSLLTFGVLASEAQPGSDEYVALGLLLAVLVGAVRIAVGALRAGVLAYFLSRPMLMGFVPAAALVIAASQLPTALGAQPPPGGLLSQAAWTLVRVDDWEPVAAVLSVAVIVAIFGGRRLHPLFPGVLLATGAAIAFSLLAGYEGDRVGALGVGLPPVSLDLPWGATPALLFGATVIALVGFAEPASIARQFAAEDRARWDANREFLSQGAANVAAGLTGGFPVGGSFSRSSLNRLAGARSRLSGAVTGVAVLAVLPFAAVLSPLPSAVLGAIVIAAVIPLIHLRPIVALWRVSRPQFLVASLTFALTLALAPRIDRAVLAGIALAIAVHLWRELRIEARVWSEGDVLNVRPQGVVWFGDAQELHDSFSEHLAAHPDARRIVLHLDGIGRLDLSGALVVRAMLEDARRGGLEAELAGVDSRDRRLIEGVVETEHDPVAG